jgi:hypothetical protein
VTPLLDEYYFDVKASGFGFLELRLYWRRPNPKWWQREYVKVRDQPFVATMDAYDVATRALDAHLEYENYRKQYSQHIAKYQTKTRIMQ